MAAFSTIEKQQELIEIANSIVKDGKGKNRQLNNKLTEINKGFSPRTKAFPSLALD